MNVDIKDEQAVIAKWHCLRTASLAPDVKLAARDIGQTDEDMTHLENGLALLLTTDAAATVLEHVRKSLAAPCTQWEASDGDGVEGTTEYDAVVSACRRFGCDVLEQRFRFVSVVKRLESANQELSVKIDIIKAAPGSEAASITAPGMKDAFVKVGLAQKASRVIHPKIRSGGGGADGRPFIHTPKAASAMLSNGIDMYFANDACVTKWRDPVGLRHATSEFLTGAKSVVTHADELMTFARAAWTTQIDAACVTLASWIPAWEPEAAKPEFPSKDVAKMVLSNPHLKEFTLAGNKLAAMLGASAAIVQAGVSPIFPAGLIKTFAYNTTSVAFAVYKLLIAFPKMSTPEEKARAACALREQLEAKEGLAIPPGILARLREFERGAERGGVA